MILITRQEGHFSLLKTQSSWSESLEWFLSCFLYQFQKCVNYL